MVQHPGSNHSHRSLTDHTAFFCETHKHACTHSSTRTPSIHISTMHRVCKTIVSGSRVLIRGERAEIPVCELHKQRGSLNGPRRGSLVAEYQAICLFITSLQRLRLDSVFPIELCYDHRCGIIFARNTIRNPNRKSLGTGKCLNNNRSTDSRSQEPHARRDACVENRKSEPATGANDRAGLIVAVSSECERTANLVKQMDRALL